MTHHFSFATLLRLVLIGACLYGAHLLLQEAHLHEAISYIFSLPPRRVLAALGCVALSYVALIFYDVLGCRYAGARVAFSSVAAIAALANAVSNMVGFALFSGGAVRLRYYTALGVPALAVVKISLFCTATFLLGLLLAASVGLGFDTHLFVNMLNVNPLVLRVLGVVLLVVCLALPLIARDKKNISWQNKKLALPSAKIMAAQYLVGLVDILATGSVAYLLLPQGHGIGYFSFISVFSAAVWLGAVSHVPGGLGVFEAVMLAALGPQMPNSVLLGALMLYRLLYYAVPFVVAVMTVTVVESRALVGRLKSANSPAKEIVSQTRDFLPPLLAAITALGGLVLLVSGATPAAVGRVEWLADFLPIGLIEGSHLMASIVGFAMLFVARGIYRRYDVAYPMTLVFLAAGVVFSLAKGFDYEEALAMALIFVLVAVSRPVFYRPSKISMWRFDMEWWLFMAIVLTGILWLLFFAYKRVEYDNYLWWQIALGHEGDASRSLRSMLVICILMLALTLYQLFRPAKSVVVCPSAEDLEKAQKIIARASTTNAFLALTGDKCLMFSAAQDAFIMFSQTGRSLIAMGDPVGNPDNFSALIWRLREMADRHQKRLIFYQISTDYLTHYIDSGMQFARLGEEALLDLSDFTLEGSRYKQIRQNMSKGEREGLSFSLIPARDVPALEPVFRAISDAWLADKEVREKSFSMGAYTQSYIEKFSVAAIYKDGRVVAFANVWATANKKELSVDLMRHSKDAPQGTMDFLFAHLLVWGKQEGYAFFNLGMAPMAGFTSHRLAPFWTKWGAFVYAHGERFYHFKGLRAFKSKYHPIWRPRYLAYTDGFVFMVLLDVAILIAGGIKGVFRK